MIWLKFSRTSCGALKFIKVIDTIKYLKPIQPF